MRRGSMRFPLRNRLFSCEVCVSSAAFAAATLPARSRSSAARFCSLLFPAADERLPVPCRDALKPGRSRDGSSFFFPLSPPLLAMRLLRPRVRGVVLCVVSADHRVCRLGGIVGEEHEVEVPR